MLSEEKRIKQSIKKLLKNQGITYSELADHMGLSLPTIRRSLTSDSISIDRLSKICSFLKITLPELIQISFLDSKETEPLSEENEKHFVKHPDAYTILRYIGKGIKVDDISENFQLSEKRMTSYLDQLESLNLIRVEKNRNVRLLVRWPAPWRTNGPLFKSFSKSLFYRAVDHFHEKTVQKSHSSISEEFYFFLDSILLSKASYKQYILDLKKIKDNYYHLSQVEKNTFSNKELKVVNVLFGIDKVDLLSKVMNRPK